MANKEISGNIQSLKTSVLEELQALYDVTPDSGSFLQEELAQTLAMISCAINREIAVYINRKGMILDISIGDSSTVTLSQVEGRRGGKRLSGLRCIHTHPNGDSKLSSVDINSLQVLRLDAIAAVGCLEGRITGITAALPLPAAEEPVEFFGPFRTCLRMDFLLELIRERDAASIELLEQIRADEERAVLVGLMLTKNKQEGSEEEAAASLRELGELARTAGLTVLNKILQKRPVRDAAYYIGRGKTEEISLLLQSLGADTLVFDEELSGAQIRNIEAVTGAKVLDRTMLILDIFAQRARSSEGKLQVELAQLKYRLPRLMGLGGQLSRLGGGIGTRGPGEKKLETDRRHIRRRVSALEEELGRITRRRELSREGRRRNDAPVAALVGYTNSGKSTLMNRLCNADVFAEDKLFATLDPTTRRLELPDGGELLLVDTVGFIRKLPHELIEAFKSTLEEAVEADLLLHVVDAADAEAPEHIRVAEELLRSLGASGKPSLLVLNKLDKVLNPERTAELKYGKDTIEVSALTGTGLERLLSRMTELLIPEEEQLKLLIPYQAGWALPYLHENGTIVSQEYLENGVSLTVKLKKARADKIRDYVVF